MHRPDYRRAARRLGGLWFDSLSANPLGVSVLPLFLVGLAIHLNRELILRDQAFAQVVWVSPPARRPRC